MPRFTRLAHRAAEPLPFGQVAGRLAAVGAGLLALMVVGLLVPILWQPAVPHDDRPPQIWLGSLVVPATDGFAAADYRSEPQLPRHRPALPPLASRVAPGPDPVVAPRSIPAAVAPVILAPVILDPVNLPPQTAGTEPEPAPADPLAEAVARAELRAPARSPLPRARPVPQEQPPQAEPAIAALGPADGLLRSIFPSRRPETVARLANMNLDADPVTPSPPAATALSIPAIDQAVADSCGSGLVRAIPRRSGGMQAGSTVIGALTGSGGRSRDDAIAAQIAAGNLPDFLRDLVPVTFTSGEGRQRTRITLCVMPDYLAVGSDRDFVRVPLGLPAAMRLAERFDMVLPTTRMVDAIHAQASVRLSPSPMEPGAQMASTQYFLRHNATVEGQRQRAGGRLGQLVAGHKKDLVLTNRLNANPGRVAIYGWHRGNNAPIQPLSTVHGAEYADYSHGIRLISRTAYVNGRAVDLRDLLGDSRLAGMISNEGTITHRTLLAALR